MCGRTACTLAPDALCKACTYPSRSNSAKGGFLLPQWKDHPGTHTYSPCSNLAPSMFCPVLIKNLRLTSNPKRDADGVEKETHSAAYIVHPMRWGFIPSFFKGETPKEFGFKTSNCRIEGIAEKNMYKSSLGKGLRCVVLCEGFYEWQTTKGAKNKQPYFVHATQHEGVEIWKKENWLHDDIWTREEGWKGPQLMKMAGIYSRWKSPDGEEIYSFAIITMESEKSFSWVHNRIPAILETFDDVESWLEEEDYKKAVSKLHNNASFSLYPVSSLVNNVKNKDETLFLPVAPEENKPNSASSKFMSAWLTSAAKNPKEQNPKTEKAKPKPEEKPKGILKWLQTKNMKP